MKNIIYNIFEESVESFRYCNYDYSYCHDVTYINNTIYTDPNIIELTTDKICLKIILHMYTLFGLFGVAHLYKSLLNNKDIDYHKRRHRTISRLYTNRDSGSDSDSDSGSDSCSDSDSDSEDITNSVSETNSSYINNTTSNTFNIGASFLKSLKYIINSKAQKSKFNELKRERMVCFNEYIHKANLLRFKNNREAEIYDFMKYNNGYVQLILYFIFEKRGKYNNQDNQYVNAYDSYINNCQLYGKQNFNLNDKTFKYIPITNEYSVSFVSFADINFIKWCIETKLIDYIKEHKEEFINEMKDKSVCYDNLFMNPQYSTLF